MIKVSRYLIVICSLIFSHLILAVDINQSLSGLIDIRWVYNDSIKSYTDGGYGKFQFSDGSRFELGNLGLSYKLEIDDLYSVQIIAGGYSNDSARDFGLTEAFIQYKSLPSDKGWRTKVRLGFIYPDVSLTNFATAWTSPYTLNFDTINGWLAEEVRHQGLEFSMLRLGRPNNSAFDHGFSLALFRDNDPTGAMLAWHGWVNTGRQSLRDEWLSLPDSDAGFVPEASDVFLELDGKYGYAISYHLKHHGGSKLLAGVYDNQGDPRIVKNVQWVWLTRFTHIGIDWKIDANLHLISQYLIGDTLMTTPSGSRNLVYNDYDSFNLMLSRKSGAHRVSGRYEIFEVKDLDQIAVDDNNEQGKSMTLSYSYRLNYHWFLQTEYSRIISDRPSRDHHNQPVNLTEQQLQLALKYYF